MLMTRTLLGVSLCSDLPFPSPPVSLVPLPQALDSVGITGGADSCHGPDADQCGDCKGPLSAVVSCAILIVCPVNACWLDE